jgi:hypothetical protein
VQFCSSFLTSPLVEVFMTRQVQFFSAGLILQLAWVSVAQVTAYADCGHKYNDCKEVVVYVCSQRGLGTRDFLGGSDFGEQEQIALNKAAAAGYDTDNCRKRSIRSEADGDGRVQKPDRILDTGYDRLLELGGEKPGYGLYSYVLIPTVSKPSVALIKEIFSVFPPATSTAAAPSQINILYLPFRKQKLAEYLKKSIDQKQAEVYLNSFYDFQLARAILNHLCNPPAPAVRYICEGDRSRGPFIFTYATPASKSEPVDPPYLLVDLRDVHERAVSEFVAAYQAQIKSTVFSDRERLDTLRLGILKIVLSASDWTSPVAKNLTDIVQAVLPTVPK